MTGYSERHDAWYQQMISEMLKFANLTPTERNRLISMSSRQSFDWYEASGIDGLYQVYADQQVME